MNCVPQSPLLPLALDVELEREDSPHFRLVGSSEELVLPIDSAPLLLSKASLIWIPYISDCISPLSEPGKEYQT